jgi:glycosyltransferase involved in cell wall biosynthesis
MIIALQVCNLKNGGTQKYVVDLANSFVKRGLKVHIICSEQTSNIHYLLDNKINLVFFNDKLIYKKLLSQYIIEKNINILHSSDWLDWHTAWNVCNKLNVTFIKTVHATPDYSYIDIFRYYLNPKNYFTVFNIIKYKLIFINISNKSDDQLNFLYGRFIKSCVIYLGVNGGELKVKPCHNKEMKVIWAGSLTDRKNPLLSIEIIKEIINRGFKVSLDIYGDGPLKDELISNIKKYDLNSVKVINNFTIESSLYKNYDFTLITSNNEGTPYVIFESMSCGVPVITTNCGAVDEIIDNDISGVIINSQNPTEFADKIVSIFNNKIFYRYMSNNAFEKFLSNYKLDQMVDKTLLFYKSIFK